MSLGKVIRLANKMHSSQRRNNEGENENSSQKLTEIFTPSLISFSAQKLLLKAVFLNIYSKGLRYWEVCRKSLK